MSNHYHLLIKINRENLSAIMQKINSRYSIYFNKKYERVGPLWQGRFKSWYVYDTTYLQTLVRYIEFNPIKANITKSIGEYRWAMSSRNVKFFSQRVQSTRMLNYELIENTDFDNDFSDDENKKIEEFFRAKTELKNNKIVKQEVKSIKNYFAEYSKEKAIYNAIKDGYTQSQIAKYLNLSNVAISKTVKIYKQKVALFNKLKDKGIFWSYSKDMQYNENLLIEHGLKYADFDDIVLLLELFGKRKLKAIWEKTMASDKRFIKLNFMLARVFFGMDVEADYFKGLKNARFEKLKLLAS